MNKSVVEKLMWSIAFPGFGQYLNGKLFKGTFLLIIEILINVQANFNQIILFSFHGEIGNAINHANYQWLMFYPCLYFFSMWDAVKDAGGGKSHYSFLPYVFSAFFCNSWVDSFFKLNYIRGVIGASMASDIVCFAWVNNRYNY